MANKLAYYNMATITPVKGFKVQALENRYKVQDSLGIFMKSMSKFEDKSRNIGKSEKSVNPARSAEDQNLYSLSMAGRQSKLERLSISNL